MKRLSPKAKPQKDDRPKSSPYDIRSSPRDSRDTQVPVIVVPDSKEARKLSNGPTRLPSDKSTDKRPATDIELQDSLRVSPDDLDGAAQKVMSDFEKDGGLPQGATLGSDHPDDDFRTFTGDGLEKDSYV